MAIARYLRRSKRGDSARRSVNKVHDRRADGRSPRREYSNGAASRHVNVPPMRRGYLSAVIFHPPPESEIGDRRSAPWPNDRRTTIDSVEKRSESRAHATRSTPKRVCLSRAERISERRRVAETFIGWPRRRGRNGNPRARIWLREISQLSARLLHLVRLYRAGARTSPSPARARKNRALCLAASGKMRSSTRQHCFPVSEYRPPRPFFPSWKYLPRPKPIARGRSWKTTWHEGSSEDLFRH